MSRHFNDFQTIPSQSRQELIEELMYLAQMASTETALFHQMAAAHNGLTITDSKTISILYQEGFMTAGQLAKRLALTTGAVTSVIDRLEALKLVQRTIDPADRRRVIVKLLPKNSAKLGDVYESIGARFQKLLRTLSVEKLQFMVWYHRQTIEATQQEIQKLTNRH